MITLKTLPLTGTLKRNLFKQLYLNMCQIHRGPEIVRSRKISMTLGCLSFSYRNGMKRWIPWSPLSFGYTSWDSKAEMEIKKPLAKPASLDLKWKHGSSNPAAEAKIRKKFGGTFFNMFVDLFSWTLQPAVINSHGDVEKLLVCG